MDSDPHDCEKSLPGMGLAKWMKKAPERHDYSNFCSSPPSNDDGFIHFAHRPNIPRPKTAIGVSNQPDCSQQKFNTSETATEQGKNRTGMDLSSTFSTTKDCKSPETTNFFKTVSSSALVNLASSHHAAFLVLPPSASSKHSKDTDKSITANNLSSASDTQLSVYKHDFSDSAPTPLDTPMTILTNPDSETRRITNSNKLKRMLEEKERNANNGRLVVTQDDTTPSTTPAVTPSCSPQTARRSENPFFTGSTQPYTNTKNSGSWLFRSASSTPDPDKARQNIMYEIKSDQQLLQSSWNSNTTSTQPPANKVKPRYVPKPSELRELNFWSPTSM